MLEGFIFETTWLTLGLSRDFPVKKKMEIITYSPISASCFDSLFFAKNSSNYFENYSLKRKIFHKFSQVLARKSPLSGSWPSSISAGDIHRQLPNNFGEYTKLPVPVLRYSTQTNMAAAEVVRWSSVVGEYGVLLTEMGSMEDLQNPIKPYPRIKVCGLMRCHRISYVCHKTAEMKCSATTCVETDVLFSRSYHSH